MLKLKHTPHMPSFELGLPHALELAPVMNDDDELTQAIESDPIDHDNNWTLDERPDTQDLENFWNQVTFDLKKDPEWADFSQD